MNKTLTFATEYNYSDREDGITLPAVLGYQGKTVLVRAKVDTGAEHCLFRYEHGAELSLPVEQGVPTLMNTLVGPLETYGHQIILQTCELTFESFVYFAKYPGLPRNLLGRNGWLRNLRVAIIDYDNLICLSVYDE